MKTINLICIAFLALTATGAGLPDSTIQPVAFCASSITFAVSTPRPTLSIWISVDGINWMQHSRTHFFGASGTNSFEITLNVGQQKTHIELRK